MYSSTLAYSYANRLKSHRRCILSTITRKRLSDILFTGRLSLSIGRGFPLQASLAYSRWGAAAWEVPGLCPSLTPLQPLLGHPPHLVGRPRNLRSSLRPYRFPVHPVKRGKGIIRGSYLPPSQPPPTLPSCCPLFTNPRPILPRAGGLPRHRRPRTFNTAFFPHRPTF